MRIIQYIFRISFPLLAFLCLTAETREGADYAGLDAYIEALRKDLGIPGIAVAIVENDAARVTKGYGVARANKAAKIDENTLFPIASTTKAFTVTALGIVVDRGMISFDDPLQKYIVDFKLKDDQRSVNLTIRDALANRSGVERGDLAWVNNPDWTSRQVIHALRYVDLAGPYRSFAYNNILYSAAGGVIPIVTGKSWGEFLAMEILKPLDMNNTIFSMDAIKTERNIVSPHEFSNGKYVPTPIRNVENVAPAGALISSASDMAKWCAYLNTNTLPNGKRLISSSTQDEILLPHTLIPPEANHSMGFGEDHLSYTLGWGRGDYRKSALLYWHSGSSDGISTQVAFLPEQNTCLVILVNAAPDYNFITAVRNWILDRALGLSPEDWRKVTLEEKKTAEKNNEEKRRMLRSPPKAAQLNLPVSSIIGAYNHPAYGDAKIEMTEDGLRIKIGSRFVGRLTYWGYTAYRAEWNMAGDLSPDRLVQVKLDQNGMAQGLKIFFSRRGRMEIDYRRAK